MLGRALSRPARIRRQESARSQIGADRASIHEAGSRAWRRHEILQLIAEGKANKQIAADLNLSVKTVEAHRAQLMDRLGIHDVAGLVRLAIRAGLVTPDR